jgi:hypothetical protein
MLQLLQVPLLFAFIASCQRRGLRSRHAVALVLVPALAYVTMTPWQVLAATLLLSVAYVWKRTVAHDRTKAPVWKLAIVASLTVVGGPAIASAIHAWQAFSPVLPPVLRVQTVPLALGPFLTWLIAIAALMIANRLLTTHHRFRSAMLAAGLAVQVGCFAIPHSSLYRWLGVERTEDVEFIAQFLRQRRSDDSGLPTVYWTAANLEDIWFALPAKSFFVTQQVAGNMFNRGTAIEGDRRAHVVSDFDLEAWHASDYSLSEWKRRSLERTYGQALDAALPTLEDLFRLCQEDGLDVAILSQDFEGWSACGNGRWFIYDCRRIRESLAARLAPSVDGSQGPARDTLTGGADRADRGKSETTPSGVSPPPDFESPVSSAAAP